MSLTPTEQRQFNDLGYLVKEDIYSQAELQPLKGALTALIDRTCATLQEEGLLGEGTFADKPFETRLGALFKANTEVGERINSAIMGYSGGGFKEQAILDFLRHSPLVSRLPHPPQSPRLHPRRRTLAPGLRLFPAALRQQPDRHLLDSACRRHHRQWLPTCIAQCA